MLPICLNIDCAWSLSHTFCYQCAMTVFTIVLEQGEWCGCLGRSRSCNIILFQNVRELIIEGRDKLIMGGLTLYLLLTLFGGGLFVPCQRAWV
jgi:hypothetical protein